MEFGLHWIRPLWLLALPLAALPWIPSRRSAGPWGRVVDPALAPFVLRRRGAQGGWLGRFAVSLCVAACLLALAGPAWRQAPQSFSRSADKLVVLLDVSRSMLAGDLSPSRLERARLKVKESLRLRGGGDTGLVAFSGHAFTVAPVTADAATVVNLLDVLAPDIMPSRGSNVAAAIARGQRLLEQAEARRGRLLLLTDSAGGERAIKAARKLRDAGHTLLVLGAATREGAPVPDMKGGFLRSRDSGLVLSRRDQDALLRLAREGGGAYRPISAGNADLEELLRRGPLARAGTAASGKDMQAQRWRDEGPLLLILLAPLAALAFRRGWVLALALAAPLGAFAADGWFTSSDRQGVRAFQQGDFPRAEALFDDPAWKAAALYRQGRFHAAARLLEPSRTPAGRYNRATALALAGDIPDAIRLYEELLLEHPGHADARHNLAVLKHAPAAAARPEEASNDGAADLLERGAGEESAAPQADDEAAWKGPMPPDQARRWLRQVPDDPGGLLRRKFQRQYRAQRLDQDGRPLWPGESEEPW